MNDNKRSQNLLDQHDRLLGGAAIKRSFEWMKVHSVLIKFPEIEDGDVRNTLRGLSSTSAVPVAELAVSLSSLVH